MGDRTFVSITIRGHFATVEALDEVAEAIANEGEMYVLNDNLGSDSPQDADEAKAMIAAAILANQPEVTFNMDECNYADLSGVTETCEENRIAYHFEWESGGDYAAGSADYAPDAGTVEDASTLPLTDLRKMLEQPDPLAVIRAHVALIDKVSAPTLSASPEMRALLAAWMADDETETVEA